MATRPYMTEDEVKKYYQGLYDQFETAQKDQANRQIAERNTAYDSNQRQNYINYMQNQRELPQNLARLGVTGGASESSMLRARTNYENNYNATENRRNADITSINNALTDTLSEYRRSNDAAMGERLAAEREKRSSYEQALQEQAENRYAKTISGFNSIAGINKEIQRIKASGKGLWRIQYLRARRTELQEAQAGSGGGYGGGGGGGYYYSGVTTQPVAETEAAQSSLGGGLSGLKSALKNKSQQQQKATQGAAKKKQRSYTGNRTSSGRTIRYYNSRPSQRKMWLGR